MLSVGHTIKTRRVNHTIHMGASIVKWAKKALRYTKTIIFVRSLKVVAKRCLNWISFHDDLCCCVEYSNVETQVEIFNILIVKRDAQKQMVESHFGCRFHDLNYFEVGIFFHIPWILLEGIITKLCENHQFHVILSYFKQILDNHLFNITYLHTTCTVF